MVGNNFLITPCHFYPHFAGKETGSLRTSGSPLIGALQRPSFAPSKVATSSPPQIQQCF